MTMAASTLWFHRNNPQTKTRSYDNAKPGFLLGVILLLSLIPETETVVSLRSVLAADRPYSSETNQALPGNFPFYRNKRSVYNCDGGLSFNQSMLMKKNTKEPTNSERAFTRLELVMIVTSLVLLAGVALPL